MEQEYPEIHYRKTDSGIVITACFGEEGNVYLPDEIDGTCVTAIAPYAFAGGGADGEEKVWNPKGQSQKNDNGKQRLEFENLTELRLPRWTREVGRYAFYRCRNLRKLTLADGILEIGGGALNGCRISETEIHLYSGERCALKSILDEIRYQVHVRMYYHGEGEALRRAEVLFPEHYEEAVENTPARILYTSHHGAGGYYRQCFYDRKLDYKKYDGTFPRALAEEKEETVIELAVKRLLYPYELDHRAKNQYEDYLREHLVQAAVHFVEEPDAEALAYLGKNSFWTKEALGAGIDCAAKLGKTEVLSKLMDEKHRAFPKGKKTFEL